MNSSAISSCAPATCSDASSRRAAATAISNAARGSKAGMDPFTAFMFQFVVFYAFFTIILGRR